LFGLDELILQTVERPGDGELGRMQLKAVSPGDRPQLRCESGVAHLRVKMRDGYGVTGKA
jgi:hypothetical protein